MQITPIADASFGATVTGPRLADQLLLTEIDADLPGDTCFPDWRGGDFVEESRDTRHSDGPPACAYAFVTYQRRR